MSAQYRDARLKIERANKHIAEIQKRIQILADSHTATVETDANSGKKFIRHDLSDGEARTDIALMVGDAVHNLNCALDHAWWKIREGLASESRGSDTRDKFPVFLRPEELEGSLKKRKIDATWPPLFRLLMDDIQPYQGGNIAIWPVRQASNMDKHRILLPLIHIAAIEGVEFEDEFGRTQRNGFWPALQAAPHYVEIPHGFHAKHYGSVTLGIMFRKDVFGEEFRLVDSLQLFSQSILGVVELLESL